MNTLIFILFAVLFIGGCTSRVLQAEGDYHCGTPCWMLEEDDGS